MDFEYKKEFYNLKYGKCYLIDEKVVFNLC